MSSTAVVLARRIASAISHEVDVDDSPAVRRLTEKGQSIEAARGTVLNRAVKSALVLARGDDELAKNALIVANAYGNRLPQAIKLMKRHDNAALVAAAYRLHGELQESSCSIAHMCRIIEALGYIPDEDDDELAEVLDDLTQSCESRKQEFLWLKRFPRLIRERLPIPTAILDYIRSQILSEEPDDRLEEPEYGTYDHACDWREL